MDAQMRQIAIALALTTAGFLAGGGAWAQTMGNPAASSSTGAAAVRGNAAAPGVTGTAASPANEPRLPSAGSTSDGSGISTRTLDLRPTGTIGSDGRR